MALYLKQLLDDKYKVPTMPVEVLWGPDGFCLDYSIKPLKISRGAKKQIDAGNWEKTVETNLTLRDWVELDNHTAKLVGGVLTHTDTRLVEE